jgi:predicted transposase/invertase (TIGR01784 family)
MQRAYGDSEVRELIEARRKAEHDEATRMAWAIQQGELKGELKGKLEGKLEGSLEGELKGKIEIARRMLAAGMDRETILQLTGLRVDDLPQ